MNRSLSAIGAAVLASGFLAGQTAVAVAAPADSIEAPDVMDMVLKKAVDTLYEETGEPDLVVETFDYVGGQDQINMTNWVVCAQFPKPGEAISPRTKKIALYVRRPTQDNCWRAN